MKIYEILTLAQPFIEKLFAAGVNPKDIQHIHLFLDYLQLIKENHKITYIESTLCDKYDIGRSKFYEIVKTFMLDV